MRYEEICRSTQHYDPWSIILFPEKVMSAKTKLLEKVSCIYVLLCGKETQ